MPNNTDIFTHEQNLVYEAHRDMDLLIERTYRTLPEESNEAGSIYELQIANVQTCLDTITDLGDILQPVEGGLAVWLANAFAEWTEHKLDMTQASNLETHPYRVYYSETVPLQEGGERTSTVHHYGTSNLEDAQKTVTEFRALASQGKHFRRGPGCLNAAWIDYLDRRRMPY